MKTSKRTLLLYIAVFGLCLHSFARPIDMEAAKTIAAKFMETNELQLASTYKTDKGLAAFYVFNTANGFVIVAADDCETPIIGYSREGRFDPNNVPVQMQEYLQDFAARIQYGIENQIIADEATARQWELVKTTGRLNEHKSTQAVTPLLTAKWHQGCLYNSLCPTMQGPCDHAEVGCVAVAMGQIMHYHGYPTTGWGSNSYSNAGATLSANFGNTTYDWAHMPDSLTENSSEAEIEAVATLLYHCGVSVKMKYGESGSIANSGEARNAMMRYFNYSRQIIREKRTDHTDEEWLGLLKNQLDQQQPVLYSAYSTGSGNVGHAFVCDGYDANDLFHFSWGWGGTGDGFFAFGNLNPNGYDLNDKHTAIVNIIPQYDPFHVGASVYPPLAGSIGGTGNYHIGGDCTLTAAPTNFSKFQYWKKGTKIVSYDRSYTFVVNENIDDIVAVFSLFEVKRISAVETPDPSQQNSNCIKLSWNLVNADWPLLKQFDIVGTHKGLATDGEHIYTYNNDSLYPPYSMFGKYSMNGELIELFDIDGVFPDGLAYDGTHFYCGNNKKYFNAFYLYRLDFEHKTVIDSTYVRMQFTDCAYDIDNDAFWLYFYYTNNDQTKIMRLVDRQGETIMASPTIPFLLNSTYVKGFGTINAKDGSPHLLLVSSNGNIYNYDIADKSIIYHSKLDIRFIYGAFIGEYDGKDALFVVKSGQYGGSNNSVLIYEIKNTFAKIIGYRLYRSDNNGNSVMLADEVVGISYIDETWENAVAGMYRFGISTLYSNGVESEIIWSDPIEKTNHGIGENPNDPTEAPVQKVFENGQIVIIKDGKRYMVTGQRLK